MLDLINNVLSKIVTVITAVLVFLGVGSSDVYINTPTPKENLREEIYTTLEQTDDSILENSTEKSLNNDDKKSESSDTEISTETTQSRETSQEMIEKEVVKQDPIIKQETPIEEPATLQREIIPPSILNETVRASVVNIFCLSKRGGFLEPITGSGIIIDEKGVILTNAHVAQYLLFKNYPIENNIDCFIRIGSPAIPTYKVELLYISSEWVEENKDNMLRQNLFSTGENDFALLYITHMSNPKNTLPESFPALTPFPTTKIIEKNDPIMVASYPAGFLSGNIISRDLWLTSSVSSIKDLFTFSEGPLTPLDLISIGGVIGAQEGSSGGAIVSLYDAGLLGVIVTRTEGETTDDRDLRALSMRHINSQIIEETGGTFKDLLSGNLKDKLARYASTTIPTLTQKLIDGLTP